MDNSDWKLNPHVLALELPKTSVGEHEYCTLCALSPETGKTQLYNFLSLKAATRMRTTRYGKT